MSAPELDAAAATEALRAVLEALDIPHAATMGDEEIRDKIALDRAGHAVVMLQSVLSGRDHDPAWSVAYLRARLAEHPAAGYKTWAERVAELDAERAAVRPARLHAVPAAEGEDQ